MRTLTLPIVNLARVLLRQSRSGKPLDFSGVGMLEPEPHHPTSPTSAISDCYWKIRPLLSLIECSSKPRKKAQIGGRAVPNTPLLAWYSWDLQIPIQLAAYRLRSDEARTQCFFFFTVISFSLCRAIPMPLLESNSHIIGADNTTVGYRWSSNRGGKA